MLMPGPCSSKNLLPTFVTDYGGFHLVDLIIMELKDHMTYKLA